MYTGIRLGRIAGVEITADWSLFIVFLLIAFSLATGLFPAWHPDWSAGTSMLTALGAALLFFGSVLAHELSHALVGRRGGVAVRRITLFVFGGMAHMENEPPSWGAELRMAIAGPIVSILIGIGCLALVSTTVGPLQIESEAQAIALLSKLSPAATILLWLGWINIVLGAFNLVPGFPLDGGRVLRSVVWGVTGDHRRATRIASLLGQGVAWLLIAFGIAMLLGRSVPVFGRGLLGGLWLLLIGWFLNGAAVMSYRNLFIIDALNNVTARQLMRLLPVRLDPATTVSTLVDRYVMASGQPVFPIERDGRFLGWVTLKNLQRSDRKNWDSLMVADLMKRAENLPALKPEQQAGEAITLMNRCEQDHVAVIESDRLLGLLAKDDLLKWMSLRDEHERDNITHRAAAGLQSRHQRH
jgi:Zn-dependent protease/predicted transcriptional regulator